MLIDTSGFLCLHHRAEPQHADAAILFDAASFRLTHSYVRFAHQRLRLMVLAEFVALAYSRSLPRREPLSFVADIQDDPEIEVVYVDERLHKMH